MWTAISRLFLGPRAWSCGVPRSGLLDACDSCFFVRDSVLCVTLTRRSKRLPSATSLPLMRVAERSYQATRRTRKSASRQRALHATISWSGASSMSSANEVAVT